MEATGHLRDERSKVTYECEERDAAEDAFII